MSGPSAHASGRIVGADGVRALACIWVFFCHLARLLPGGPEGPPVPAGGAPEAVRSAGGRLMEAGDHGVAAFFVLSGFLLSLPFWKAHRAGAGMPSLRDFARRRLARIVPGYYLCVALLAVLFGVYRTRWGCFQLATMFSFTNTLFHATYRPDFDVPLWSISIEMLFYVLLPVLAWGMFRCRGATQARAYWLGVIALLVAGQYGLLHIAPGLAQRLGQPAFFSAGANAWSTHRNAAMLFTHFLIGLFAADAYLAVKARMDRRPAGPPGSRGLNRFDAIALTALGLLLVAGAAGWAGVPSVGFMVYHWPTPHLLVGALLVTLPFSARLGPVLDSAFFRVTANLSFAFYMWHVVVFEAISPRWPAGTGPWWLRVLGLGAVAFGVSYGIAALSYYLLERPVLNWAHGRAKAQAKAVAAPVADIPQR